MTYNFESEIKKAKEALDNDALVVVTYRLGNGAVYHGHYASRAELDRDRRFTEKWLRGTVTDVLISPVPEAAA